MAPGVHRKYIEVGMAPGMHRKWCPDSKCWTNSCCFQSRLVCLWYGVLHQGSQLQAMLT